MQITAVNLITPNKNSLQTSNLVDESLNKWRRNRIARIHKIVVMVLYRCLRLRCRLFRLLLHPFAFCPYCRRCSWRLLLLRPQVKMSGDIRPLWLIDWLIPFPFPVVVVRVVVYVYALQRVEGVQQWEALRLLERVGLGHIMDQVRERLQVQVEGTYLGPTRAWPSIDNQTTVDEVFEHGNNALNLSAQSRQNDQLFTGCSRCAGRRRVVRVPKR